MKYIGSNEVQSRTTNSSDAHEGERLVFFMENAGICTPCNFQKCIGVDQGRYTYNNRSHSGRLQINNDIYDYNIVEGSQPKLIVHKLNKQEPIAVCEIPPASSMPHASQYEQAGIVLSVCSLTNLPA